MPSPKHPRRGSMQYWPRKRSTKSLARIRSWADEKKAKPLGFICYKAGMTHLQVLDNRPKSTTKGEEIVCPATIIECPPMKIAGISFYKNSSFGLKKSSSVLAQNLDRELSKKISLPKKTKNIDEIKDFVDLKLLVFSLPSKTNIGSKKPKLIEIAIGGSIEDKLQYAKEVLGKEIKISDAFEPGNQVDVHGITKGKGFQGTVKRFGVPIRQHKAEKTKRGIGNLGGWTPKRVLFNVPQSGKMGYHLRTEYNKQIVKIGENVKDVNKKGGIMKYGVLKNPYVLIKGSVVGPRKRAVVLTQSIRPNKKITSGAPEITFISLKN